MIYELILVPPRQGNVHLGNSTSTDVIGDRDYESPVASVYDPGQGWGLTQASYGLDGGPVQ